MSLDRNKGAIELEELIGILLIILASGFIIGIFTVFSSRAEEKTAENLCLITNALRYGTKIEIGPIKQNIAPSACKTIDKDIPGKYYTSYLGGKKEGAKAEMRELIEKCWNMWLEGKQLNMFDTSTFAIKNKCFICYTFSLNKDVSNIGINDFTVSLNAPYSAVDKSDRCNANGQGGYCRISCDKYSIVPKEAITSKCSIGLKCCIAEDNRDECLNKGGKCSFEEGYAPFDKWQCKTGSCYIKKENFVSYLDYVQGTNGASSGAGFIALQKDLKEFNNINKYAMTFVSPGDSLSWDTAGFGAATILLAGGSFLASYIPIIGPPIAHTAIGGAIYTALLTKDSGIPNINYLYISEYDAVKDKCAVEAGVGEES